MLKLINPDVAMTISPPSSNQDAGLRLLLAAPRGFCAGVTRAIDAVRDALHLHGAPVYVRRAIVHNLAVVAELEAEGAIFVQELDEVPEGAVVMFSAHGVSPAIKKDAADRGLKAYDAVCPLVSKVHNEVRRHQSAGRTVILIGHHGHPEIMGTLGHADRDNCFVVDSPSAVAELPVHADAPTAYAVQTTYSVEDARQIVEELRARFADLAEPSSSDICYATTNRQQAIGELAAEADAVIVVGERISSNACRLAEVAGDVCGSVQLVAGAEQIDWSLVPASGTIGITAAASTPERSVQEVVSAIRQRHGGIVSEYEVARETAVFKPLKVA